MPVRRVPVVHKFGIVSVSRAEQLLHQSREELSKKHGVRPSKVNAPLRISQSFITKYNATPEAERKKLDSAVMRAFTRAKYKAGLHKMAKPTSSSLFSPAGEFESVSDAWLEFILLCQCYGSHQEEVLLALATSLNHAPLSITHIPSLLYMAGLCFQWLKSDLSLGQAGNLRTGELLLLRIIYLISLRLFFHHKIGRLESVCTREEIRQLKFDIEGFESREKVYRNFPEALLHWKVALEVGQSVIDKHHNQLPHDPSILSRDRSSSGQNTSTHSHSQSSKPPSSQSGRGDHGLPPVLWHSLDMWQVVRAGGPRPEERAISDLVSCSVEFAVENWMESLLAIQILCTAAQLSFNVLQFLQSLASGTLSIPASASGHLPQRLTRTPSLLDDLQSASLLKVAASPSLGSEEEREDLSAPYGKKGTRFLLPPSERDSSIVNRASTLQAASKHMAQVDTLNILGIQPSFREPYPESVVSVDQTVVSEKASSEHDHYLLAALPPGAGYSHGRQGARGGHNENSELESVATQSLVDSESVPNAVWSSGPNSHSQVEPLSRASCEIVPSRATLGEFTPSPSESILFTSDVSQALRFTGDAEKRRNKEATIRSRTLRIHSENILAVDESQSLRESLRETLHSAANTTTMEEKLAELDSPLSEVLDRVNLLDNHSQLHSMQPIAHPTGAAGRNVTLSLFPRNIETRCTHYTHSSGALSDGAGVPGSHIAPSTVYRHSVYSAANTISLESKEENTTFSSVSRFENWPSEVALAYTLNMGCVVIYGRTSRIQSVALEGMNTPACYGLKQLATFSNEESKCDFSAWSIRHGAILSLSRVCRTCRHLPAKDGLSSVAWSSLLNCHTTEHEQRVLEALKLSHASPDVDEAQLSIDPDSLSSPLLAHMADGLAQLFLPPITPKATTSHAKNTTRRPRPQVQKTSPSKQAHAKVDTHLKREVPPPPDFICRTLGVLNRIAEEDWKREMQREREEELKDKVGGDGYEENHHRPEK